MSMIGNFRRLSDDELASLIQEPDGIESFLYPDEGDANADEFDVDKAWHAMHFLLTGSAWEGEGPKAFILAGGQVVGNEDDHDVGYGPARGFASADVRAVAAALDATSGDELRSRFDPEKLMAEEIYPTIWDRPPTEDDALGYVLDYFEELREFVRVTAERGMALLVYIN